jgi:hypothetical protein
MTLRSNWTALQGSKKEVLVESVRDATPDDVKNKNLVLVDRSVIEQLLRDQAKLATITSFLSES